MRLRGLLGSAMLLVATGCATSPPLQVSDETVPPAVVEDVRPVAVYLVPLDDFNVVEAGRLARQFSDEFGLRIKSAPPLSSRRVLPFSGTRQYPAEDIVAAVVPMLAGLPDRASNASYVLLSNRDINSRSRQFRFLFSWHDPISRVSVVSTARLQTDDDKSPYADAMLATRLGKMTRRAIGEVQLGWARSPDIGDVMYAPIMSLRDVDRMGATHRP